MLLFDNPAWCIERDLYKDKLYMKPALHLNHISIVYTCISFTIKVSLVNIGVVCVCK